MSSQGHSGTASGGQLEEKADFSKETDEKLAQVVELVQNGALPEALAILGALEKRCRVGNDNASLDRVCAAAVTACHDAGDHAAVIQTINTYSTRRSQKMTAIKTLVQTPLPWCVQEPYTPIPVTNAIDQAVRNELVACLRDVTAGKLFLERERAQLTRALAKIKVKKLKSVWGRALLYLLWLVDWIFHVDGSNPASSLLITNKNRRTKGMWRRPRTICKKYTSKRTGRYRKKKRWNTFWNNCD
jgi:hypothetical protein